MLLQIQLEQKKKNGIFLCKIGQSTTEILCLPEGIICNLFVYKTFPTSTNFYCLLFLLFSLITVLSHTPDMWIYRDTRQLDYISQFMSDNRYIKVSDNIEAIYSLAQNEHWYKKNSNLCKSSKKQIEHAYTISSWRIYQTRW